MTKRKILYLILTMLLAGLMFIAGELDDSPGLQLIGLIVGIFGIVVLLRNKKKISK